MGSGGPGGDAGGGDPGGSDAGSGHTDGDAGGDNAGGGERGRGDRADARGTAGGGTGVGSAFAGGRFRTGDLGRWRDGRLEVLGRADDVIVTGGEKVAPAAVERVLAAQPGVRAACVVGLPDAEWGQVVAAAVVWEGPAADAVLQDAVRIALGRAAVPRLLVAVARAPAAWDRQARSGGRRTPRERRRRTASPGSVSPPRHDRAGSLSAH